MNRVKMDWMDWLVVIATLGLWVIYGFGAAALFLGCYVVIMLALIYLQGKHIYEEKQREAHDHHAN